MPVPMPRNHSLSLLLLPIALTAATGTARADRAAVDRARTELGELRYQEALATLDRSLRSGTNNPAELAEVYLLRGEVRASLGDHDDAIEEFRHALAIDPAVELREGLSPKIREPFAEARRSLRKKMPLRIVHRHLKADEPVVAVLIEADPLKMVVGARLVYWEAKGGAQRSVAGSGTERVDLTLPEGVSRFMVAAIDKHGNRIAELGSEDRPLSVDIDWGGARPVGEDSRVAASPRSTDRGGGPPLYAHFAAWAGAAAVFGGVGIWAGLETRSAVDELDAITADSANHEFSEAQAVAERAQRRALVANVSFGLAGACAIVSGVLFFRRGGDSSGTERAAIAPMISPDTAGVTARLPF
jgi:tetratricopeptide (TPR) repeat protein